jgi:hypothetical protein
VTSTIARLWRRVPLTIVATSSVALAEVVRALLPDHDVTVVTDWASTNVDRLSHDPVLPMVASAFVVDDHSVIWLALLALGCATVELGQGWRRAFAVILAAHVGGTLFSEGMQWWRIGHGRLPDSARYISDVGASYIVAGLLTAGAIAGASVWLRGACALALLAIVPSLTAGLTSLDVAALGHVGAICVTGMLSIGFVVAPQEVRERPVDRGFAADT